MMHPAAGMALRRHVVLTRFVPGGRTERKQDYKLADRIPEVRALLRTDLPFTEIAVRLGVSETGLRKFIRRRSLCDLRDRATWINRQKSIASLA